MSSVPLSGGGWVVFRIEVLRDDQAARALTSALRSKRTLRQLSLAYCGYSSDGVASISKLLLLHTGIEDLSVRGNYIGAEVSEHHRTERRGNPVDTLIR